MAKSDRAVKSVFYSRDKRVGATCQKIACLAFPASLARLARHSASESAVTMSR